MLICVKKKKKRQFGTPNAALVSLACGRVSVWNAERPDVNVNK